VVLRLPQELKSIAPAGAKAPVALGILAAMIAIMTAGLLPNGIPAYASCSAEPACVQKKNN
jgi:hypothetical protein